MAIHNPSVLPSETKFSIKKIVCHLIGGEWLYRGFPQIGMRIFYDKNYSPDQVLTSLVD